MASGEGRGTVCGGWACQERLVPACWPGSLAGVSRVRRSRAGGWRGEGCVRWEHALAARPCALISRGPAPADKPRPAPPGSSPRLRLWPGQCSAGLDSAWRRPRRPQPQRRHGPLASHPARDQLPQRCGPRPGIETGDGVCGPSCDLCLDALPTEQRSESAALGAALGVGSWSPRRPGPCPARTAPGARSSRGWLGGLQPRPRGPAAPQPRGPAAPQPCRVSGGGAAAAAAGAGRRRELASAGGRSALSPPALCRVPAQLVGLPPASEGTRPGLGNHWGRLQAGWLRASPHCS